MRKLLIVALIPALIGCKTLIPVNFSIQNERHVDFALNAAIAFLDSKGFPIADNFEKPVIVVHATPEIMKKTIGLKKERPGWYNPETRIIHLTIGCGPKVIVHELQHFLLHLLGIPINLHHEIMGCK